MCVCVGNAGLTELRDEQSLKVWKRRMDGVRMLSAAEEVLGSLCMVH